jgi:hypothetical protein
MKKARQEFSMHNPDIRNEFCTGRCGAVHMINLPDYRGLLLEEQQ